jgi:hypothetical protein
MDERHEQTKDQTERERHQRYRNGDGCSLKDIGEEIAHN